MVVLFLFVVVLFLFVVVLFLFVVVLLVLVPDQLAAREPCLELLLPHLERLLVEHVAEDEIVDRIGEVRHLARDPGGAPPQRHVEPERLF